MARHGVPRRRRPVGRARPPQGREAAWRATQRPASRKGLTGSGLGQRLREGYLALAARDPERWIVVDNTDADLDELVAGDHRDAIVKARARGVQAAVASARAAATGTRTGRPATTVADHRQPRGGAGGVPGLGRRARAARAHAGGVRAVGAGGSRASTSGALRWRRSGAARDRARPARAVRRRVVAAAALAGRGGAARDRAVARRSGGRGAARPGRCASCWRRPRRPRSRSSLQGLDDETAWALRDRAVRRACPTRCMTSLGLLDNARAWHLRERWIARARHAWMPPSRAT